MGLYNNSDDGATGGAVGYSLGKVKSASAQITNGGGINITDANGIDMTIWKSFYAISSSIIYACTASTVRTGESVTSMVTLNFELG
jgi:hypothetical protein